MLIGPFVALLSYKPYDGSDCGRGTHKEAGMWENEIFVGEDKFVYCRVLADI